MAWEWSHTQEAYDYAHEQAHNLPRWTLETIFAEWSTDFRADGWKERYTKCKDHAATMPKDFLVDYIWDCAEEQHTCDNGGFNAWICPSGCHTVPFSPPEQAIPSDGYADGGEPYTDEELAVING